MRFMTFLTIAIIGISFSLPSFAVDGIDNHFISFMENAKIHYCTTIDSSASACRQLNKEKESKDTKTCSTYGKSCNHNCCPGLRCYGGAYSGYTWCGIDYTNRRRPCRNE